ncbi:radical SAM protein [Crossiella sp. CA-258035]|uniref:cyclophane-forming radical SAM peptide maturase AmcB n=1 Tax=Crossiella sp. CA-258035 TaxID=2981138 RepID=UPI0024BCBF55|nr:cyclophane-forming radical SAM peptide maturase AmcB [Crossiella sp. CA-258035]WHT20237.1 radical SAM protein [Crossiella sp. CA-258035]
METTTAVPFLKPTSVIMQPTTLCNMDCQYCYLPDRAKSLRMLPVVAQAVARAVADWADRGPVDICWHGGEPLAAGRAHLRTLADTFAGLNVTHTVQTNATLIDSAWCDFFESRQMRVGVSIDGPATDNRNRTFLNGRESFDHAVRGIRLLVERGFSVSVIAVVPDPTPERAQALYEFIADLGVAWLGVNIEEREGVNSRRTAPQAMQVAEFWAALIAAWRADPRVQLREAQRALGFARNLLTGGMPSEPSGIDVLPTVAWNGEVTLISPELAGFRDDRLGNFACGSLLHTELDQLIEAGPGARWVQEFVTGVQGCRAACRYFQFCGGAHPANRFFEHGRLDGGETDYCRNTKMALVEGVLLAAQRHRVPG